MAVYILILIFLVSQREDKIFRKVAGIPEFKVLHDYRQEIGTLYTVVAIFRLVCKIAKSDY
jgi:hypothetical protein